MSSECAFPTVCASKHASRTLQPLTELTDKMKPSRSTKAVIKLSMGDPTADGNLVAPQMLVDEMMNVVQSKEFNGYPPVAGYDESRQTVADYWTKFCTTAERKAQINWKNTLLTSGGSHAIVLAISALCNEGDNLLVGAPAFPHYKTVCDSYGVECRYFPLDASKNWEADLEAANKLVDSKTRGVLIVNPSNPCGSNYSRAHVEEIVHFCEKHKLPLIADEIYAELVFKGETFTSIADFDTDVPRLVMGGSAKHAVTPGWRIGWLILIDRKGVAKPWMNGMDRIAQLLTGSNSLGQMSLVRSLTKIPQEFVDSVISQLEAGAKVYDRLLEHNIGISFDAPRASMFIMLKIDFDAFKDISTDMEFYEKLLDEENVQVLPGEIFGVHGFVRATTSRPAPIVNEAVDRIIEFCERHKK
ncbi:tyrosine aminotransferase [Novymonas esmeraldas]|uniref:Tyrosine aminotransferase n=1 Tax=Novymonas esmeraldas TaxID=1808958 RepID=A0AAW0F494_9TRYP